MIFPEFVTIDNCVHLKKMDANISKWVYKNVPNHILGEVYSNIENESFFKQEINWTINYIILDNIGAAFGIIRIIPEVDEIVSLHGMGWPNHQSFSKNYFRAWVALTELCLSQFKYLNSNCRTGNLTAFRILEQTGYQFSHFGFHKEKNQRSSFFKLDKDHFIKSQLKSLFGKQEIIPNGNINFLKKFNGNWNSQKSKSHHYSFETVENLVSDFLKYRIDIILPKIFYNFKMGEKKVEILILQFDGFRQIYIALMHTFHLSEWLYLRDIILSKINLNSGDLLFLYSKENYIQLNCFVDRLTPMGFSLENCSSVWRI